MTHDDVPLHIGMFNWRYLRSITDRATVSVRVFTMNRGRGGELTSFEGRDQALNSVRLVGSIPPEHSEGDLEHQFYLDGGADYEEDPNPLNILVVEAMASLRDEISRATSLLNKVRDKGLEAGRNGLLDEVKATRDLVRKWTEPLQQNLLNARTRSEVIGLQAEEAPATHSSLRGLQSEMIHSRRTKTNRPVFRSLNAGKGARGRGRAGTGRVDKHMAPSGSLTSQFFVHAATNTVGYSVPTRTSTLSK